MKRDGPLGAYTNQCICQLKPRVGKFVHWNAGTGHNSYSKYI